MRAFLRFGLLACWHSGGVNKKHPLPREVQGVPSPQAEGSGPARPQGVKALTSLQCKATLLIVFLTLGVTAAVSAYLLRYGNQLVRAEQTGNLIQAASLLAQAVQPALADGDRGRIEEVVGRMANGVSIVFAAVADADGNTIASVKHPRARGIPAIFAFGHTAGQSAGIRTAVPNTNAISSFLEITYPVSHRGVSGPYGTPVPSLLGDVRVGMVADSWERSMVGLLDWIIGIGMIAAVIVVPLGFLLVRRIVGPIEELADTMTLFADGRLDVRSSVSRRDELGRLSQAFNRMAEQHWKTHRGLARLNAELEERVAFRTRQLREIASREPLTGLYNRRHFNEVLQRRFAEAQRYGTDLSCIMVDLDGFKDANDAFGHQVGDELLILTAATILSQLRTSDVAARYGGDEFIVLLPQTDATRALVLAERIMDKFNRDQRQRFPGASVSMSMGIAHLADPSVNDGDGLVRAADQAMYRAKSLGRDRIESATLPSPAPAV